MLLLSLRALLLLGLLHFFHMLLLLQSLDSPTLLDFHSSLSYRHDLHCKRINTCMQQQQHPGPLFFFVLGKQGLILVVLSYSQSAPLESRCLRLDTLFFSFTPEQEPLLFWCVSHGCVKLCERAARSNSLTACMCLSVCVCVCLGAQAAQCHLDYNLQEALRAHCIYTAVDRRG